MKKMKTLGLILLWGAGLYIISLVFVGELVRAGLLDQLDGLRILYPFYLLGVWFGVDFTILQVALIIVGVKLVGLILVSVAKAIERGSPTKP
jgi:hypothetical protein